MVTRSLCCALLLTFVSAVYASEQSTAITTKVTTEQQTTPEQTHADNN